MTMLILIKSGSYNSFMTMAMLASGAVANDISVKIFAMDEAVYALKKNVYDKNVHIYSTFEEFNLGIAEAIETKKTKYWWELLDELKELGEIEFYVCSLVADLLDLETTDFIPLIDGLSGVASFTADASEADIIITL
jgi:peroxiredoxin family protein